MGLPGGNADPEDTDLLTTALREATEEMGPPPPHKILQSFLTKRGKQLEKHYTVYLAEISPEVRATWRPQLNEEHTAFEWVPLNFAITRPDLHPVVKRVLREEPHKSQLFAAVGIVPPSQIKSAKKLNK